MLTTHRVMRCIGRLAIRIWHNSSAKGNDDEATPKTTCKYRATENNWSFCSVRYFFSNIQWISKWFRFHRSIAVCLASPTVEKLANYAMDCRCNVKFSLKKWKRRICDHFSKWSCGCSTRIRRSNSCLECWTKISILDVWFVPPEKMRCLHDLVLTYSGKYFPRFGHSK